MKEVPKKAALDVFCKSKMKNGGIRLNYSKCIIHKLLFWVPKGQEENKKTPIDTEHTACFGIF